MKTVTITRKQMIACAERELAVRQEVLPNLAQANQMTVEECEHEILCMAAIAKTLKQLPSYLTFDEY